MCLSVLQSGGQESSSDSDTESNHDEEDSTTIQKNQQVIDERYEPVGCGTSSLFFSTVYSCDLKTGAKEHNTSTIDKTSKARLAWKKAFMKVRQLGDPWAKFDMDKCALEKARRHRYNPITETWTDDDVVVKMEKLPFDAGAMRECFRLKKMSNSSKEFRSLSPACNFVAKRYINQDTPRDNYFLDVHLQMDAKLWAEEYNRHNPPKKVDIFQMSVLEMVERTGHPLFHLEHFIEGKYIKYNSNSGFVQCEHQRNTPQAFSHFTFERSGHELIIADVQGVGDLYTDPQIHTAKGSDYGDGNLGTRGMALFLHSHTCNDICHSLGLTPFDLAPSEIQENIKFIHAPSHPDDNLKQTMGRGTEELTLSPIVEERFNIHEFIRKRSISCSSETSTMSIVSETGSSRARLNSTSIESMSDVEEVEESATSAIRHHHKRRARNRYFSECSDGSNIGEGVCGEQERLFVEKMASKARPSNISGELQRERTNSLNSIIEKSILGQIHLDLAKYHEVNRFVCGSENFDVAAAMFHLEAAAECGILEATITMARLHLGLPHDILPHMYFGDECDLNKGFVYLETAAEAGDRASMVYMAEALRMGVGLPKNCSPNWILAVRWYEEAVYLEETDSEGHFDGTMDHPRHQLVATQAHMYLTGGHNLAQHIKKAGELFNWAAELATEAMKGKLASKYYMQAEEAWAQVPEE